MFPERGWVAIHIFLLFVVLTSVALFSGHLLILLALGISAYELAINSNETENASRRVLASHTIAIITGFVAYHALAPGISALPPPPSMSIAGLRLIASGAAGMFVTMLSMRATDLHHYPAYATSITLSIGLLTTIEAAIATFIAVIALIVAQSLFNEIRQITSERSI